MPVPIWAVAPLKLAVPAVMLPANCNACAESVSVGTATGPETSRVAPVSTRTSAPVVVQPPSVPMVLPPARTKSPASACAPIRVPASMTPPPVSVAPPVIRFTVPPAACNTPPLPMVSSAEEVSAMLPPAITPATFSDDAPLLSANEPAPTEKPPSVPMAFTAPRLAPLAPSRLRNRVAVTLPAPLSLRMPVLLRSSVATFTAPVIASPPVAVSRRASVPVGLLHAPSAAIWLAAPRSKIPLSVPELVSVAAAMMPAASSAAEVAVRSTTPAFASRLPVSMVRPPATASVTLAALMSPTTLRPRLSTSRKSPPLAVYGPRRGMALSAPSNCTPPVVPVSVAPGAASVSATVAGWTTAPLARRSSVGVLTTVLAVKAMAVTRGVASPLTWPSRSVVALTCASAAGSKSAPRCEPPMVMTPTVSGAISTAPATLIADRLPPAASVMPLASTETSAPAETAPPSVSRPVVDKAIVPVASVRVPVMESGPVLTRAKLPPPTVRPPMPAMPLPPTDRSAPAVRLPRRPPSCTMLCAVSPNVALSASASVPATLRTPRRSMALPALPSVISPLATLPDSVAALIGPVADTAAPPASPVLVVLSVSVVAFCAPVSVRLSPVRVIARAVSGPALSTWVSATAMLPPGATVTAPRVAKLLPPVSARLAPWAVMVPPANARLPLSLIAPVLRRSSVPMDLTLMLTGSAIARLVAVMAPPVIWPSRRIGARMWASSSGSRLPPPAVAASVIAAGATGANSIRSVAVSAPAV